MRSPRIKPDPDVESAYYHLITKTVNGEFLFHDAEKDRLRRAVWAVAERCGIQILTYELMTNHFHIVALAPKRERLSDEELLRRYKVLHPGDSAWEMARLELLQQMLVANGEAAAEWRRVEQRKASNISEFMKLLKQRFSRWFNLTHERFGTLWYERFKSVLLEPGRAVRKCMVYVNTNAARARICSDPTSYRFGAYMEALRGSERARKGIMHALGAPTWADAIRIYRRLLLANAGAFSDGAQDPAAVSCALTQRCRHFTDGAVLGSVAFVQQQLERFRELTGRGQRMRAWRWPILGNGLLTMRKLRDQPAA